MFRHPFSQDVREHNYKPVPATSAEHHRHDFHRIALCINLGCSTKVDETDVYTSSK